MVQQEAGQKLESLNEVERTCLLFEAGDYPDRGVTITEDDLRRIAAGSAAEVPVRVEHLRESPFDSALGVVTGLTVQGGRLWGILRQPAEAIAFLARAGARALSVAIDMAAGRLTEVSFVCKPRVASARVFGSDAALVFREIDWPIEEAEEEERMGSVRQIVEGVLDGLKCAFGGGGQQVMEDVGAEERERLRLDREAITRERAEARVAEFKRRGLIRASPAAEQSAEALLQFCTTDVFQFDGVGLAPDALFARFLEANGPVVPMGEMMRASAEAGPDASKRLGGMARDRAKRDGVPYLAALTNVCTEHPELARAAREESTLVA